MTRTFWLSFADVTKPKDAQFLGAAIIEVTDAEVDALRPQVRRQFPHAQGTAFWIAAAARKARRLGCNPGGEVGFVELDPTRLPADTPRGQLLTRVELISRGFLP